MIQPGTPDDRPVRVALLGCGHFARAVPLPILARLPRVAIAALSDPDPASRDSAAGLAPSARCLADYRDALELPDLDAVVICLPNALHAEAAQAALQRGLHVYLEKPLATQTADGERVVEAWRRSGLVGMMGFNYRYNALYSELRELLRSGAVGEPLAIRSTFATPRRTLPGWKATRASGGGVLLDLASHHVDVVRFVLGSEVREVSARIGGRDTEADTATLDLVLANGVSVQSFFSWAAVEEDRMEVYGDGGKLVVDRYASLVVERPATTRRGARLAGLRNRLRTLHGSGYILEKLRSPWQEPSYRTALEAFVAAVRGVESRYPDFTDGLRSLVVLEAAEQAAETGRSVTVEVDDAGPLAPPARPFPRATPRQERTAAAPEAGVSPAIAAKRDGTAAATAHDAVTLRQEGEGLPALSVVLVTPDRFATIRRTIGHLRAQTIHRRVELVLVAPSLAELAADSEALEGFHSTRVVELGAVRSIARANGAGVRAARADVVALGEDHSFPDPEWAEALVEAHRHPYAAVGPVVRNGNPTSSVSWADYLIGYGPWMDPTSGGEAEHLPGHNSSYKRAILLAYGPRLEEMLAAESLLHWDLRAKGHRLYLNPRARTSHLNFGLWSIWVPVQFLAGRVFGGSRAADWPALRRVAFTCASPLIAPLRFWRILGEMRRHGRWNVVPRTALPVVFFGLVLDAAGQMVGYAAGSGDAKRKLSAYEFHRIRYAGEVPAAPPAAERPALAAAVPTRSAAPPDATAARLG